MTTSLIKATTHLAPEITQQIFIILLSFFAVIDSVDAKDAIDEKQENKVVQKGFSMAELTQLTGHFSTSYGYFHVTTKNNMGITESDGKRIYLIKKEDGRVYPMYKLLGFIPINKTDTAITLEKRRGRLMVIMHTLKKGKAVAKEIGEKFIPRKIGADWLRRLGRYKVKLIKGKSNLKTLHFKSKNHVFLMSMNKDTTTYPFIPYVKNKKSLHGSGLFIPGSDEGHLVQLFMQNKQLMLRTKRALMALERIK